MTEIDPKFDIRKYIKEYGELDFKEDVPERICRDYEGKLPDDLILLWRENGIGTWLSGKFQLCIPSNYAGVVDILFSGDSEIIPEKTHIVGFSAFGHLLIWSENLQTLVVDLTESIMRVYKWNFSRFKTTSFRLSSVISMLKFDRTFDYSTENKQYKSLFSEALSEIGEVTLGQCYGFFPALALGGSASVKHIQIVDARVHFTLLAQMGPVRILRLNEQDNIEFVRNAGAE